MSAIASFHLLTKTELQGLRELVQQFPPQRVHNGAVIVPTTEGPRLPKVNLYSSMGEYLEAHGKEPYEFDWSGYVIDFLLEYLKEEKEIDLMKSTFDTGDDLWVWYLFDTNTSNEYLHVLDPEQFDERELKDYLNEACSDDVPTAGKAMLDGIRIIHQYLSLINCDNVVLLHVG